MAKIKHLFSVSLLLMVTAISAVSSSNKCAQRSYGNGAHVCVCNATYCDTIEPIAKTAKGIVTSYLTSISGERFEKTQLHFVATNDDDKRAIRSSDDRATSIKIDHRRRYQAIIGFGGAFTDSAGLNIARLPLSMRKRLIADYFAADGIEYSLGRIPIGGSDFSTRPYTYDDHGNVDDKTLSKFALEKEDHEYKIPFVRMASSVATRPVRYFASPWSAPAWMKTNHQIRHGGLLIGAPGGQYYKLYAHYFVKFLQAYAQQNITMWGLTIENEPGAGFNPNYPWNSLGFNKTLERDFLKLDLGPELHAHGYTNDKLKVMIFDDQLPYAKDFVATVMQDRDAAKYVSGVAFHWYETWKANRSDLDSMFHEYPGKFFISTEACEEWHGKDKHVSLGNWATFNRYADDIIKNLNHFTSGWVDWNMALDLFGGPNWVGNLVDSPVIVNETAGEYYKQPFFYALGHFAKFLIPDSVRVHHDEAPSSDNVLITVFERPDNSTVITVLNKNRNPITLNVHDPAQGHLATMIKAEALQSLIYYH